MTAGDRVKHFGVLWLLVVAGAAAAIEPALRNGIFIGAVVLIALGWVMIAGMGAGGDDPVPHVLRGGGADADALAATGNALVRCGEEFSVQFDNTRGELGRAQQIFSDAIVKLIDSFNAMSA